MNADAVRDGIHRVRWPAFVVLVLVAVLTPASTGWCMVAASAFFWLPLLIDTITHRRQRD